MPYSSWRPMTQAQWIRVRAARRSRRARREFERVLDALGTVSFNEYMEQCVEEALSEGETLEVAEEMCRDSWNARLRYLLGRLRNLRTELRHQRALQGHQQDSGGNETCGPGNRYGTAGTHGHQPKAG